VINKKIGRIRRAGRARAKIRELAVHRLCINRSNNHVYAQIISPDNTQTLVAASSLDKEIKGQVKHGGNKASAALVGKLVAERAKKAGITKVAFDRSGFKYHGCIKALADAAREVGIEF
jgi:large subunit ribosomal protein L18